MWTLQRRPYRLPFRQTVRTAHGAWAEREGILIRAEREVEGRKVVGWGEAAPIPWFGSETVAEAEAALAGLEGRAENLDDALARVPAACTATRAGLAAALGAGSVEQGAGSQKGGTRNGARSEEQGAGSRSGGPEAWSKSGPARRSLGEGGERGAGNGGSALDSHGQDARATRAHEQDAQATQYPGGRLRDAAEAEGDGSKLLPLVGYLPVAGLLPAGRAALAAVEPRLELGFRVFKWKVGVLPAADEWALLDDLLARLPAGAKLRLDANGAWDRRTAEGWLARAAERPVEYVEQPCFAPASEGEAQVRRTEDLLRGLASDYPVKLALDESVNSASEVERWLAEGWEGVWVLKLALLGEPGPVLTKLARAGADVVFGSALETAVGARAALRIAFAWAEARGGEASARRALGFGVWPLFQEGRANAPWAGPFVRREDLERVNAEALWAALGEGG